MSYDRTTLLAAAQARGDQHYREMGQRLGVSRATAWRLWTGRTAPSAVTAAACEREYGVPARQLLAPATA
ncbi:XRE family transcriptional regulator [Streptomyces sp. CB04723]|uniref:XRE family transcriptional regulator n=1 Tax=Streptomyces TaxID=1883 RepID=UPI0015C48278|nr:XRE family transcriptional regulator [Streptomyces sp. CB04723]QLG33822.1 XRE family transcriptional regulator [Streptomyces sp. CB04723]